MHHHWVGRGWISEQRFIEILAQSKFFPGPYATLVGLRLCREVTSRWIALCAGLAFILPAVILVLSIATGFIKVSGPLQIIFLWLALGITTQSLFQFAQSIARPVRWLNIFVALGMTLLFPDREALWVFIVSLGCFFGRPLWVKRTPHEASLVLLFVSFMVAALISFGSGIAVVPNLYDIVVHRSHWLEPAQFFEALVAGQMTPGPLVIMATHLGYQIAGIPGAAAGTFGIFLPTFVFGLWLAPFAEKKLFSSPRFRSFFLDFMPAVIGGLFGSFFHLLRSSITESNSHYPWKMIFFLSGIFFSRYTRIPMVLVFGTIAAVISIFFSDFNF